MWSLLVTAAYETNVDMIFRDDVYNRCDSSQPVIVYIYALAQRINHDDVPYLIKFYVIRWLLAVFREFATDTATYQQELQQLQSGDWRGWRRGRWHREQFARKHLATRRTLQMKRCDIIDEHRQLVVAVSDAELVQVQTAHQWDVIKKWLITRLPVAEQDPDLSFQGHGQTDRWTDRRAAIRNAASYRMTGPHNSDLCLCRPWNEYSWLQALIFINIREYYVIFNIRNMRFLVIRCRHVS